MVIKIDKEAEKLLIEIVDGYTKYVGFRGINNVNALMRGVQLLPVVPPKPIVPEKKAIESPVDKPEMKKVVDEKMDVPNVAKK